MRLVVVNQRAGEGGREREGEREGGQMKQGEWGGRMQRGNERERGSQTESDGEWRQKGQQICSPREDKRHRLYLSAERAHTHTHTHTVLNIGITCKHTHTHTHTLFASLTQSDAVVGFYLFTNKLFLFNTKQSKPNVYIRIRKNVKFVVQ